MPLRLLSLFLLLGSSGLLAQAPKSSCAHCVQWNRPQAPFRIFGDTYYVGPHGLSSILIVSPQGNVLLDGALPESAPLVADHVRTLGFRVRDIKLILNSHAHFDHAGGIAELQRLSGARVAVSPWTARALRTGQYPADDPQFGLSSGIQPVARVETIRDGQVLRVGPIALTAHFTPGHTPGGTSWTWTACQNGRCLHFVYADSLNAVSNDTFRFTRAPKLLAGFDRSFTFLRSAPCDVLLTPHPDNSHLWDRVAARSSNLGALVDPAACHALADQMQSDLRARLARERQSIR